MNLTSLLAQALIQQTAPGQGRQGQVAQTLQSRQMQSPQERILEGVLKQAMHGSSSKSPWMNMALILGGLLILDQVLQKAQQLAGPTQPGTSGPTPQPQAAVSAPQPPIHPKPLQGNFQVVADTTTPDEPGVWKGPTKKISPDADLVGALTSAGPGKVGGNTLQITELLAANPDTTAPGNRLNSAIQTLANPTPETIKPGAALVASGMEQLRDLKLAVA